MSVPDISALPGPIAVVANDAGAANLLFGWLEAADMGRVRAHLGGPAQSIWQAKFPGVPIVSMDAALDGAQTLLSGTGWSSALEHESRALARAKGIRSIAVIDHWVNYRDRFVREGIECQPDTVWVGDRWALEAARAQLPEVPAEEYENRYLGRIVERVRVIDDAVPRPSTARVLYALEPIRTKWAGDDPRPGEFQALDFFMANRAVLGLPSQAEVHLRPHPSDSAGKYDEWLAGQSAAVSLAPDKPIEDAVSWATHVAACESFVLLLGLAAGRTTISTIPPWGNPLRLPQPGIVRLAELTE